MDKPVRILVAEDNDIQRQALMKMLREIEPDCALYGASDAQEALLFCEDHSFDLLITDICMPLMDGTQLAESVHSYYPDVQIAFLTAYPSFEYAQKAISLHVYEYVLKPVDRATLATVVRRMTREIQQKSLSEGCRQYALAHIFWSLLDGEENEENAQLLAKYLESGPYCLLLLESDSPFFYSRQAHCADDLRAAHEHLLTVSLNERQLAALTLYDAGALGRIRRFAAAEGLRVATSEPLPDLGSLGPWRRALDSELCAPSNQGKAFLEGHAAVAPCLSDRKTSSQVRRALSYIDSNYAKPISLSEVAQTLSLSAGYLSSVFRKEIGCTYVQYVTELRMKAAERLLETTGLRVSEIARQVGYPNAAYFATLFRNATGFSPAEWRERK